MEEISKILKEYARKKYFIVDDTENKALLEIVNYFIELLELDDYLLKLEVSITKYQAKSDRNRLAVYLPETKELVIFLHNILNDIQDIWYFSNLSNSFSKYYEANLYIFQTIIHEIEHILRDKSVDNGDLSIESELLRMSNRLIIKHNTIEISGGNFYKYLPEERLAKIYSNDRMIKLIPELTSNCDLDVEVLSKPYQLHILRAYIQGYEKVCSVPPNETGIIIPPTKICYRYLNDLDSYNALLERVEMEALKSDERMALGLPVSEEDYNAKRKQLIDIYPSHKH